MKKTITMIAALFAAVAALAWTPGEGLKTRWAAEINPASPLPEYPRPQMVRTDWLNLNGLWNYERLCSAIMGKIW